MPTTEVPTAKCFDAVRQLRWTSLLLVAVALVEAFMLNGTFPAKNVLLKSTVECWFYSIPAIAAGIALVVFRQHLKFQWQNPSSIAGKALLCTVAAFHIVWTVAMTGG